MRDLKAEFANLDPDIPMICLCGNHDVGNSPTQQTIAEYRTNFGDDYFYTFGLNQKFCLGIRKFTDDPSRTKR